MQTLVQVPAVTETALRIAALGLCALLAVLLLIRARRRRGNGHTERAPRMRRRTGKTKASPTLLVPAPTREPASTPHPAAPLEDPLNTDVDPSEQSTTLTAPVAEGVGYAELSRDYATRGRGVDAALAQWAADLRVVGPLLDESAPQLPPAQAVLDVTGPRHAVTSGRELALELVSAEAAGVPALFASVDHVPERSTGPAREPAERTGVNELLARAEELMTLAGGLEHEDPTAARDRAREADLTSFEALLLESALTYGDEDLVSVGLRRDLALAALREYDERRAARSDDPETPERPELAGDVERVRGMLRLVVESHELDALEAAFVPVPGA